MTADNQKQTIIRKITEKMTIVAKTNNCANYTVG